MKKLYLFTTRLIALWVLLPLIFLLALSIKHTGESDELFKLYPLIILSSGAIIFSVIYFFRAISISYSEIKQLGFFSSRDSAIITEGKKLIIEREKKRIVKIILFGNDGVLPGLDWMKNTYKEPEDIVLFRGRARYGKISIKRILRFFGASKEDIALLLREDAQFKYEFTTVTSKTADEKRTIEISIDKTV